MIKITFNHLREYKNVATKCCKIMVKKHIDKLHFTSPSCFLVTFKRYSTDTRIQVFIILIEPPVQRVHSVNIIINSLDNINL